MNFLGTLEEKQFNDFTNSHIGIRETIGILLERIDNESFTEEQRELLSAIGFKGIRSSSTAEYPDMINKTVEYIANLYEYDAMQYLKLKRFKLEFDNVSKSCSTFTTGCDWLERGKLTCIYNDNDTLSLENNYIHPINISDELTPSLDFLSKYLGGLSEVELEVAMIISHTSRWSVLSTVSENVAIIHNKGYLFSICLK